MKDKKTKIALIVLLIIVFAIIIYLMFHDKFNKTNNQYLIINYYLILQKDGDKWNQIEKFNEDVLKQKYTIYGDTKKENLKLQYNNNKLYYFDKNYKEDKVKNMRAATSNFEIKLTDYEILPADESDEEYTNEALNIMQAGPIDRYTTNKYIGDFNNNGKEETLYVTSNYVFDIVNYPMYSILFTVDNQDNVKIIDSSKDSMLTIEDIMDLDNDGEYEVIVSKDYINLPTLDTCYKLYKLEDNKWVNKKECKKKSNI